MLCRPTVRSFFRAETRNTHIFFLPNEKPKRHRWTDGQCENSIPPQSQFAGWV